ncbi:hypothetical protein [Tenacibaculum geojense]|uniref:Uncharacterized protein n=1 Tax=Tenacibaculum geojense TaxID=915352 RepID=A0ABW3JWU2_9FLAO
MKNNYKNYVASLRKDDNGNGNGTQVGTGGTGGTGSTGGGGTQGGDGKK